MSPDRLLPGEIRIGPTYEAERAAIRSGLAAAAQHRRLQIGSDLVLVFETRETVRAALEERLRADRVNDAAGIAGAIPAFARLIPGDDELAATLYVDIADPAALADRLAELGGVGAAVSLEVSGHRIPAGSDATEDGAGALHLVFALDERDRRALVDGGDVEVAVDHPGARATCALSAEQVLAIAADIGG
jgi:hypothetical protein